MITTEQRDELIDSLLARAASMRPPREDPSGALQVFCEQYANEVVARYARDLIARPEWYNIGQATMSVTMREHPANRFWAAVFYDRVEASLWASLVWRKAYETARYGEPRDYWAEEEEIRAEADAAYERATK